METIARNHLSTLSLNTARTNTNKLQATKFWEEMEFNRFGVVAWTLSIVACFSGIVVGFFVDGSNQLEITLAAVPTVATLASILAVAPVRWVLGIGSIAVLINILLMIF